MRYPNFDLETRFYARGYHYVAGVDEVGRGCLAGPVVAAAVILDSKKIPKGLNDSKMLTLAERERLDPIIRESCVAFAIGVGEVDEIDSVNILNASKNAMVRAVHALNPLADFMLLDGNFGIPSSIPSHSVIGGDRLSVSIAAASIIAKVYRDRLMHELDKTYPGYLFAQNKGYGSEAHRIALAKQGPCAIHRKSFSWTPVRAVREGVVPESKA